MDNISKARLLVSYLGEKNQFNWCDTSFLNETGIKFLGLTFPKTSKIAAFTSACEAAKRYHDQHIGKNGVIHLFRQPFHIEQKIFQHIQSIDISKYYELITSREIALAKLQELSSDTNSCKEGPLQIDQFKNFLDDKILSEISANYQNAFKNNIHVFPYQLVKG